MGHTDPVLNDLARLYDEIDSLDRADEAIYAEMGQLLASKEEVSDVLGTYWDGEIEDAIFRIIHDDKSGVSALIGWVEKHVKQRAEANHGHH